AEEPPPALPEPSSAAPPAEEKKTPEAAKPAAKPAPEAKAQPQQAKPQAKAQAPARRQDIRVDLEKLDNLINLIGEIVIAENMLIRNPDLDGLELENFQKAGQHMSKLVRELQEMAMVLRMIPVSGLFRRMIRLVHDISLKAGKKVELKLSGEETEMDKTVIETITDPLVHILRNSCDHGIEPPEERRKLGKPEKGVVRLSACHEEGEVWITIEDDGRGLDRDKLLAKAISKGLVEGDGSDMSDKAIYNLIFAPGFSTADKITDISGRGVGMDVVRQNLDKIKGRVEVNSKPGKGTRINLRIPLTLAIIDGMLVRIGQTKAILPTLAIREAFRPREDALTITPDGDTLIRVRESFYPVLRLYEVLGKQPDSDQIKDGILITLENQDNRLCLLVDEILGQQQTVIKGLSDYIGSVRAVSGCTIMGNGEVCLILDVGSLMEISHGETLAGA
ncbi:MAG TPA: chemotaxis protein CheA, partial [Geoalkalibacter subterraneus]|nr:chemotaxis protein CheA [Geoalkalibacter subterraneus]